MSRSLVFEDRQDIGSSYHSSYYPHPTYGPPPHYGPPEIPPGEIRLEFTFRDIILKCVTEDPYEHIVWLKFECPQQLLYRSEGIHIADGSRVKESNLYEVHITAHAGKVISELRIRKPYVKISEGVYQCQAWPHVHGLSGSYLPPGQYNNPITSDVFIFGSTYLLEHCFHVISPFKQSGNKEDFKENQIISQQKLPEIKPRGNITDIRKISNSKQLHYDIKYNNDSLYKVNDVNDPADFVNKKHGIIYENLNYSNSNILRVPMSKRNKTISETYQYQQSKSSK